MKPLTIGGKAYEFKIGFAAAQKIQSLTGKPVLSVIQSLAALELDVIAAVFTCSAVGAADPDALLETAVDEHGVKTVMEVLAMALAVFLDRDKAIELSAQNAASQKKATGLRRTA